MEIQQNQIFELVIEDENVDEVFAISLVEEPAIESNFVYFDKEKVQFAALNDEKRLLMGPILLPNKKILRIDGEGKPYYVFFKPETIKRLSEMYLQKKYTDKATLEHDKKISGVHLVESWVVESREKDKSRIYGLTVPVGTWMGTFKIDNEDIWNNYVKTGEVKGFSIEGLFGHSLVEQSVVEFSKDTLISQLEEQEALLILSEIKAIIKKDKRFKSKQKVEMESYSDYGSGVANNAKRGIELNEKNGNKCATPVGKVRAQQLAQNRPISVETIKRMYSYLSRAEVYYDQADSNSDCGYISFLLWGGKSGLSWSRNKLRELGLLEESESQPSISSTYPGEQAKGKKKYKSKALLQADCPEATQNIEVNLANRQKAIDEANYGPENPNEPNEEYWRAKADQFEGNVEAAKKALCDNCSFFYRTQKVLDCIAEGLGTEVDPYDAIEAGQLGYCGAYDFKCSAQRTCDAWLVGGSITD
jgi:hypothetical protein